ncbi:MULTISPECIES: TRAP transporter large permease [Alphaproteobacteria]|uniref:TRAP transporter large permease protein n=2 Tax=Alphaproteobacteria TaxID=28211 RepID=A0A512HH56_9HYPH|nr:MULTISPECIES: TRAP transporter large permease [Alphaproteobacteria]GEO84771.1 C4-dicarboxylate ABC transporter permease [Ciceribacter naphthalenivorans]GLR20608.1 C4-dicarboxylate ABC transporter permease [Ciceribacter naphthalenivorans]GLT03464.1 C4-dicarboxylate ABC transporter permease [Sphingomonas psychrolutea]
MSGVGIGVAGLAVLFVLLALRVPVAFAMFLVGLGGMAILNDLPSALSLLASESFSVASSAELIIIPMFILMGNVATESGMSRKLYDSAYAWIGSIRGGLASATILGCAGFAALSGSSVASALTMGRVSLSQMNRFGYSHRLSTGAVAAGGTLGILIPPSTGFVIYAILTRESIGRLFMAGILPGIMLVALFVLTIWLIAIFRPADAPAGERTTWRQKWQATIGAAPITLIVILTIGGIYLGVFSPVEAAAVGAGLSVLFGFTLGEMTVSKLASAVMDTVATSSTVLLILIAASVMGPFLALSHIPAAVGDFLTGLDIGRYGVLMLILLSYLVLGCFLEGFAMLVLTMPIFFPVIVSLGFDPIWFGVVVVLTLEMGLITPPVGINVFIVKSVARDVALIDIFRGVFPFLLAMLAAVALLILFPSIALLIPQTMFG